VGNHGVESGKLREGSVVKRAKKPAVFRLPSSRAALALQNWPVSRRLIAVIVLALIMGLVFGGLRVASAAGSAAQFGRVSQLANLGQQVTGLVQALQDERDETAGVIPLASTAAAAKTSLPHWYSATDAAAASVRGQAAAIGGSFPANIQARVATVLSVINHLGQLRSTAQASQSALSVIAAYSTPIADMLSLDAQIAQGTSDSGLANDVQSLNSLSLAKDQAAQQRALLFNAFSEQLFADGEQQALTTAVSVQSADLTAFGTTATPAEQNAFHNTVAGPLVNQSQLIEEYVLSIGSGGNPLDISSALGIPAGTQTGEAAPTWYGAMSDNIDKMQTVELDVARNIVARAHVLQRGAAESAVFIALLTVVILLLVLGATVVVARSLVRPLRRLRAGALDIATVQLPERVRLLGESDDPAESVEVAPIDVLSADEIGQVARAFDQVHSEAVRLAGNEAMLRSSFNAMFVNLSRRSQSLIERLARTIDSLEQNEEDPDRLSNLFAMDHMVTRMRRNSENLLLLAGHESARKWSEPVPLADVARAAISEIEQYARVGLNIQPGIAVSGQAASDVVRLLAEIIENATTFSPKETQVRVSAQELTSGGVLIEVSDSGVGVSYARLAEINRRLDDPPVIDASVARHMGLFAVGRLAERHGVRVRLRAATPRGLSALVWLPDSLIERGIRTYGGWSQPFAAQGDVQAGRATARHSVPARSASDGQSMNDRLDNGAVPDQNGGVPAQYGGVPAQYGGVPAQYGGVPAQYGGVPAQYGGVPAQNGGVPAQYGGVPAQNGTGPRETMQAASQPTSSWFQSRRPPAAPAAGNGSSPSGPSLPVRGGSPSGSGEALPVRGGSPSGEAPSAGGGRPPGTDAWSEGRHAARIISEPVRSDRTVNGLPVRVPRANLLPGSVGGGQPDSRLTRRPAAGPEAQAAAAPERSPELARNRLSGFQRGARRAEGQQPRTEGADR
jgi:signal transduction histidine kinase